MLATVTCVSHLVPVSWVVRCWQVVRSLLKNSKRTSQDDGDWLGDDGGVVVRVVARVEEVVMQRAVEPVVEELDGPGVQQRDEQGPVGAPQRQVLAAGKVQGAEVKEDAGEDDLVVPVALPVHLLELDAAVDDLPPAARVLEPGDGDPRLVVEHPEDERRHDGQVAQVRLAPSLGRSEVGAVRYPRP